MELVTPEKQRESQISLGVDRELLFHESPFKDTIKEYITSLKKYDVPIFLYLKAYIDFISKSGYSTVM